MSGQRPCLLLTILLNGRIMMRHVTVNLSCFRSLINLKTYVVYVQDEAEADGAGVRVPEAVLRLTDGGEPTAAAGGGGAARDAGGPAHRALPAHPAAAPGVRAHHVPALRAHHGGHDDGRRRPRRAHPTPGGSRGEPLPPRRSD